MPYTLLKKTAVLLISVGGVAAGWASADEASVRQALRPRLPPTVNIESVTRAPFFGLYEVVLDGEIVYTDEKAEYFFGGTIYDIRTLPPRNVTQDRLNQMVVERFTKARDLAIKRVRGNGARTLWTFEDPNCPYCKSLNGELAKMDNVTIYTFLLPILSQDSIDKSVAVWCAKDRAAAWEALMSGGTVPTGGATCSNPIDQIAAIARRFQIQSTPAIFLGNGTLIGGMRSAADIERAFAATTPR